MTASGAWQALCGTFDLEDERLFGPKSLSPRWAARLFKVWFQPIDSDSAVCETAPTWLRATR